MSRSRRITHDEPGATASRPIEEYGDRLTEATLGESLSTDAWRRVHRTARRRAIAWSLRRIAALPLLAITAAVGAVNTWGGLLKPIGLAASPFFALAALGIHLTDVAKTVGGRVEILVGEVLGRFPQGYDNKTAGFDGGRKRQFLVDGVTLLTLTKEGNRADLSARPEPRALRATHRAVRDLRAGDDAVLIIINDRILDRLDRLIARPIPRSG